MTAIRFVANRSTLQPSSLSGYFRCDAIFSLVCNCDGRTGHVEQLRGAVEELRVLETQATVSFYTLQNLFGGE